MKDCEVSATRFWALPCYHLEICIAETHIMLSVNVLVYPLVPVCHAESPQFERTGEPTTPQR